LFAILFDVQGATVLDLYAGSGALGLEALSRGAARAVLVETSKPAQRAIKDNIGALGLTTRATLLPMRAESALGALGRHGPFSLVFADPPWADAQAAFAVLARLASASLLAPAARLVLEHAARSGPEIPENSPLRPVDTRRWGDTAVTIFEPLLIDAQAEGESGPVGGS
jgi:16S rRNA (guanine966-N2)-methyltransferase